MRRKTAFTLIELLVVTSIISLLAGLLFPVFAQARQVAKRTLSLSNVKQISLAQFLYMDDWEGAVAMNRDCYLMRISSGFAPCRLNRGLRGWIDLTVPYVKSYAIFKSPNDSADPVPLPPNTLDHSGLPITAGLIWAPRLDGETLGGERRSSYARNNNFSNNGTYTAFQAQASSPSTLILIYTFTPNSGAGASGNEGVPGSSFTIVRHRTIEPLSGTCRTYDESSSGNARSNFLSLLPASLQTLEGNLPSSERYLGRGVYGFADGHAASLAPERIRGQCGWGDQRGVELGNNGRDPDFRF